MLVVQVFKYRFRLGFNIQPGYSPHVFPRSDMSVKKTGFPPGTLRPERPERVNHKGFISLMISREEVGK